jgi:hypothetical protein
MPPRRAVISLVTDEFLLREPFLVAGLPFYTILVMMLSVALVTKMAGFCAQSFPRMVI